MILTPKLILVCYCAGLIVLGIMLSFGLPGPGDQEILGVHIASGFDDSQKTFISGRKLTCIPARWDAAPQSTCSIGIAGKELVIQASRNPLSNPNQLGGSCSSFYGGEEQPCNFTSKSESYHWVARVYLKELTDSQQASLRRRYVLHNLPSDFYFVSLFVVLALTAVVVGSVFGLANWHRARLKPMVVISSVTVGLVSSALVSIIWFFAVAGPGL